tara:strand:+ start:1868 stop:2068 length:201 start_codon:yes stop_codon:yes gene_type:complete
MKHDIVFATDKAYQAAKTLLTPYSACRFNGLDDRRIEFYSEGRRRAATFMFKGIDEIGVDDYILVS